MFYILSALHSRQPWFRVASYHTQGLTISPRSRSQFRALNHYLHLHTPNASCIQPLNAFNTLLPSNTSGLKLNLTDPSLIVCPVRLVPGGMVFDQARSAGWIFGVTFSSRTSLLAAPVLHRHLQVCTISSTLSPTSFALFTHPTLIPCTKAPQLSREGDMLFGLASMRRSVRWR